MCRSPNYEPHSQGHEDAGPFTITAFYVRLRASRSESNDSEPSSKPRSPIPDSLTLLLYPPLSTCNQNNNSKIPPFSPATLSLRRMRLPNNDPLTDGDVTVFGCKQSVRATTQVMRFQLYAGETKLLKGAIRKIEDNHHSNLKLECCKCELIPGPSPVSISEAELLVALDGHVAVSGKVTIKEHKMRNNKHGTNKSKLEDIPEETELRLDADVDVDVAADANPEIEEAAIHLEMDLEVLRKAMDMGIWALCLGLGFMVSKASITSFRPRPTFF